MFLTRCFMRYAYFHIQQFDELYIFNPINSKCNSEEKNITSCVFRDKYCPF